MVLAAICAFWAQSASAAHWMMTGRIGQSDPARVAGIDRDSVVAGGDGTTHATILTIESMASRARKTLGQYDVDCPRLRVRSPSLTIWSDSGARDRIFSGPDDQDWKSPENADDRALITAVCSRDYAGMTDLGDKSPDAYAASLLGTPPDFGQ